MVKPHIKRLIIQKAKAPPALFIMVKTYPQIDEYSVGPRVLFREFRKEILRPASIKRNPPAKFPEPLLSHSLNLRVCVNTDHAQLRELRQKRETVSAFPDGGVHHEFPSALGRARRKQTQGFPQQNRCMGNFHCLSLRGKRYRSRVRFSVRYNVTNSSIIFYNIED